MAVPFPSPTPIKVARLATLDMIERQGRGALATVGAAGLADWAAGLYAVAVAAQADGMPGAKALDTAAIEDLESWLNALADEREAAA